MNIVIQINPLTGIPATDTGFAMIEADRYRQWLQNEPSCISFQSDTAALGTDSIPVGTIEWTEQVSGIHLTPINVPPELRKPPFVSRTCLDVQADSLEEVFSEYGSPLFVKSGAAYKKWPADLFKEAEDVPADFSYFVSTPVDFIAEWRAFIFRGSVVDVRQYSGDWRQSKNIPIAWLDGLARTTMLQAHTIDFGLTEHGPELIEIHPFISCGLYGFENYTKIIQMTVTAWREAQRT